MFRKNKNSGQRYLLKMLQQQIMNIKYFYHSSKYLNNKQKDRLDYFIDRSISFCDTLKKVKYSSEVLIKDKETRIVNRNQYKVYCEIYEKLILQSRFITVNSSLHPDNKKELLKCLSYVIGYTRGKINTIVK